MIETRLAAAMTDSDFPRVAYAGLKREESHRAGSMVLHERYFGGLGGNGNPGGPIYEMLDGWFGGFVNWLRRPAKPAKRCQKRTILG